MMPPLVRCCCGYYHRSTFTTDFAALSMYSHRPCPRCGATRITAAHYDVEPQTIGAEAALAGPTATDLSE
jgi:hypothetical protein